MNVLVAILDVVELTLDVEIDADTELDDPVPTGPTGELEEPVP